MSQRRILWAACTVFLAAAVCAASQPPAPVDSPRQVAATLDGLIQPRFQKNAGRFGIDRVVIGGHDNVYELATDTRAEKQALRRAEDARRPFVIGFLHIRHKPGTEVGSKTPDQQDKDFKPYLTMLASASGTQKGAEKLLDWGYRLEPLALSRVPALRTGKAMDADYENWFIAFRPIRADRAACLSCHAGAKHGDTLGVMVYAVDQLVKDKPSRKTYVGGVDQ